MRMTILGLGIIAALILAIIIKVSPNSTVVANEVSGEVYAIDIFGITKDPNLPVQQAAMH